MTVLALRFRLVLAALCLVLCGACRLDVAVGVETLADGHGEVRVTAILDEDAARLVDDVRDRLRTGDLREAGWVVDPPQRRHDGSVVVVARRAFAGDDGAQRALADLGGDSGDGRSGGPFEGFTLRQRRTFLKTTTTFSGNVDLTRGIEAFADAELTELLGGSGAFGVPVDQLERRFGAPMERLFGLRVAVDLPGRDAAWTPELGRQTPLSATAEQWNVRNLALAAASLVCGVAAVVVLLRGRRAGLAEPAA